MEGHREDAGGDVLPDNDPDAEDVMRDRPRLHVPLRGVSGGGPPDDGDELGLLELESQKRELWQARVRAGVQTAGRIVRELGSFLASFDEWGAHARGPRLVNTDGPQHPIITRDCVLPLHIQSIRDKDGGLITYENSTAPVEIPPGGNFEMQCRPQVFFKPRRVLFLSTECDAFEVQDAKIGKNSQWAASGPVAARIFSELSFGMSMEWETAQVSMDVILSCKNISKEKQAPPRVCVIGQYAY